MELMEKTVESRVLFEGKIITVRLDKAELPNGRVASREVVEHPGGVAILPLFDDGTVEKSLTAADFDEIGCAKVYFIYPPETKTSICHNLSAYQDGEYMGLRR